MRHFIASYSSGKGKIRPQFGQNIGSLENILAITIIDAYNYNLCSSTAYRVLSAFENNGRYSGDTKKKDSKS